MKKKIITPVCILLLLYGVFEKLEYTVLAQVAHISALLFMTGVGFYTAYHIKVNKKPSLFLATALPLWTMHSIFASMNMYFEGANETIYFLYLVSGIFPSLLLAISAILYVKVQIVRWHIGSLLTDIGTMFLIMVLSLWKVLEIAIQMLHAQKFLEVTSSLLIITADIIVLVILLSMQTSGSRIKENIARKFVLSGMLLFSTSSLLKIYAYMIFQVENVVVGNFCQDIAALLIVIALLHEFQQPLEQKDLPKPGKETAQSRLLLTFVVLILPMIVFLTNQLSVISIILIMGALLVNFMYHRMNQRAFITALLLNEEKRVKENLEFIVKERTRDLEVANKRLVQQMETDRLTGILNRKGFVKHLEEKIQQQEACTVCIFNINRFKVINEVHGYLMGDKVLIEITKIVKELLEDKGEVYRISGDEFAIIMKVTEKAEVEAYCEKLLKELTRNVEIEGFVFELNVSLGITRYPYEAVSVNKIEKYACVAMNSAKNKFAQKRYAFFDLKMIEKIERRHTIEKLLKKVDYDTSFRLFYQPIVNTKKGELIGMEALLRWENSEIGTIPPGEFIPIAEEIGLIGKMSMWVFEKAMEQIKEWNDTYGTSLVMGINLSPLIMNSSQLYPIAKELIKKTKINPKWIDLEITEHSAMNSSTYMEVLISSISELGASISIDDFGTGYSSLAYINRFEVDRIKIARELIEEIEYEPDERLIVTAIIRMAEGLNVEILAEGIETKEQLGILESLGCSIFQGYYFAKPMPKDVFEKQWLKGNYKLPAKLLDN